MLRKFTIYCSDWIGDNGAWFDFETKLCGDNLIAWIAQEFSAYSNFTIFERGLA